MLNVHPRTLRRYELDGEIPCVRLPSGRRRFRLSDIQRMIAPIESNPASNDVQ
jgi:predicted site-specific integrase-resolvase